MSKLEPIIPETASTGTIHKAANHALCQANIEVASNTCDTSATIKKKPRVEREHQRKATIKLKTELIELD